LILKGLTPDSTETDVVLLERGVVLFPDGVGDEGGLGIGCVVGLLGNEGCLSVCLSGMEELTGNQKSIYSERSMK